MVSKNINDYLYTWNVSPPAWLKEVQIEDDIRDGMQAAFVRKPSLEERKELLECTAKVGTYSITLGFPAISQRESEECGELLKYIEQHNLGVEPSFLSRVHIDDLRFITKLSALSTLTVRAEMFFGTSPLRRKIEGWDLRQMLNRLQEACRFLGDKNIRIALSIEDSTRTPPDELERVLNAALDGGVQIITICDTVGDCTPDGAARITEFALEQIVRVNKEVKIAWHGHNDKGLSVANAMASARAGAYAISGTFLGIGERSGNIPLEQVVLLLYQAGNRYYNLEYIQPYCQKLAKYTETMILPTQPLMGKQAFATSAGTHSSAILKARKLGHDFEDYVFSAVPASKIGRFQNVLIGPTSGMANARYMLEQVGAPNSEQLAHNLLAYAKTRNRWLSSDDIHQYLNTQNVE